MWSYQHNSPLCFIVSCCSAPLLLSRRWERLRGEGNHQYSGWRREGADYYRTPASLTKLREADGGSHRSLEKVMPCFRRATPRPGHSEKR